MRIRLVALAVSAVFAALSSSALAASWVESVDGDLSGDRLAPSSLALAYDSNWITGSTTQGDLDYITVVAPFDIAALVLTEYTGTNGIAFIAVQAGAVFTEPNIGANPENLLGWTHFGYDTTASAGTDILDNMGAAVPAIGFSGPLPAGTYTFWIQQTSPAPTGYTLEFVGVPEPAGLALLGAGLAALARLRRRA